MVAIDLSNIHALDADLKEIQQLNFIGNQAQQATIFFIIENAKETVLDFHKEL